MNEKNPLLGRGLLGGYLRETRAAVSVLVSQVSQSFAELQGCSGKAVGVGSRQRSLRGNNSGGSPRVRAVRKEHGAGGRADAGRAASVFELVLRARLWVRRVCVASRARAVWVRSGRGAEFEEVRGRAGRLAAAVRGASPGVGSRDGLDEDWPRADAPRATEAAREQSRVDAVASCSATIVFIQVFFG